jgi:hypothetical protein
VLGGLIGLMLMRVAARWFIYLLERFPRFEISAYLLVIVIGLKLLADWGFNSDWSFDQPKWLAGHMQNVGIKQPFERFEQRRLGWVHQYEDWLREKWAFGLAEHHSPPPEGGILHTPHLLDFHSPRRPEFIVFWTLMVACFLLGFWPTKRPDAPAAEKSAPT